MPPWGPWPGSGMWALRPSLAYSDPRGAPQKVKAYTTPHHQDVAQHRYDCDPQQDRSLEEGAGSWGGPGHQRPRRYWWRS